MASNFLSSKKSPSSENPKIISSNLLIKPSKSTNSLPFLSFEMQGEIKILILESFILSFIKSIVSSESIGGLEFGIITTVV